MTPDKWVDAQTAHHCNMNNLCTWKWIKYSKSTNFTVKCNRFFLDLNQHSMILSLTFSNFFLLFPEKSWLFEITVKFKMRQKFFRILGLSSKCRPKSFSSPCINNLLLASCIARELIFSYAFSDTESLDIYRSQSCRASCRWSQSCRSQSCRSRCCRRSYDERRRIARHRSSGRAGHCIYCANLTRWTRH